MSDHSRYSPSQSKRWVACPGSLSLAESMNLPEQQPGPAAQEGTRAHQLLERCLRFAEPDTSDFPDEMVRHIEGVVEYIDSLKMAVYHTERRLSMPIADSEVFGTADVVGYSCGDTGSVMTDLHVVDLKYGYVPVDPQDTQFVMYGVGALELFKEVPSRPSLQVHVHVCQPRLSPIPKVHSYTLPELWVEFRRVRDAVIEAQLPNAQRTAGDHCRWCPAAAICPELRSTALAVAKREFDVIVQSPPPPASLTLADAGEIIAKAELFSHWLASLKEHVTQRMLDGETVPGWKLTQKRTHRKWHDEAMARAAMEAQCIEPEVSRLRTPAEAEKAGLDIDTLTWRPVEFTIAQEKPHAKQGASNPRALTQGD